MCGIDVIELEKERVREELETAKIDIRHITNDLKGLDAEIKRHEKEDPEPWRKALLEVLRKQRSEKQQKKAELNYLESGGCPCGEDLPY